MDMQHGHGDAARTWTWTWKLSWTWAWARHGHRLLLDRHGQLITLSSEGIAEELAEDSESQRKCFKILAKASGS
jgi:hypothetical protein